jgi:glycerate kinase
VSTLDPRLGAAQVVALCDVDAPLLGAEGAARRFAPQKGATPAEVETLERGLAHLARLVGASDASVPGAGAAGGLGFGLGALIGASLRSGCEVVFERVGFHERVCDCDLVLTGEGRLDAQSRAGKVVGGVLRAARPWGVPVVALAGRVGPGVDQVQAAGLRSYEELARLAGSDGRAEREVEFWLVEAAARAVRSLRDRSPSG